MKRFFLFVGVLAVVALASCSKEKTCTCTTSYTGEGSEYFTDATTSFTTEEDCSDANTTIETGGITATMACEED